MGPPLRLPAIRRRADTLVRPLSEARLASVENHVFFDLDATENVTEVRTRLQMVAEKEMIAVAIESVPGRNSLLLQFSNTRQPKRTEKEK